MMMVSIFFFNLGIIFFVLLIISVFYPALTNQYIDRSKSNILSEQLSGSIAAMMVICFITGIVIYLLF